MSNLDVAFYWRLVMVDIAVTTPVTHNENHESLVFKDLQI
jgi:hypothetical protein